MEQLLSFDSLSKQVERQQRKAQFRTLILSIVAIAIVGLFLLFTFRQIEHAQQQLKAVNSQIVEANANREQAQASLKTTQEEFHAAETRAAALLQQVRSLEAQLAESQKALTSSQQELVESKRQLDESKRQLDKAMRQLDEAQQHLDLALNLERYIYELKWEDFKSMYTEYRSGARVLEIIRQLKNRVHWDPTTNSSEGAYNSPGFATLVLQQLNRLPSNGLAGLPQDKGTPNVGDIVAYEGGYRLYLFP